ncbi:hypothetical protein [Vreelandella olivaria]|uniref:hypothetical protein n=1 Tax=Vreelandella olivaria TaxID=390919 RepID=UPI00201F55FE|nr:hypothetical protein [Halomonas olivaria]
MKDEHLLDLGRLQGMVLAAGMIARSCPVEAEEILRAAGIFAGDDLDGCAAYDIKQLIEARIEIPGLHAAWQKARREESAQDDPERSPTNAQAGFAAVRHSFSIDDVFTPTVEVLLKAYAGLSNADDLNALNSSIHGTTWVEEILVKNANTPRSKGIWRRIAYRDFLSAMSILWISPLRAIDAMKKLLVQPDIAGRQLAFLVDVMSDLMIQESPSAPTEDIEWELGEVYAETTLDTSSVPHEPREWLMQAYMEFRTLLTRLSITPDHVHHVLAARLHGDSKWDDRRPEGK